MKKRILAALSGGVDSAVTALLLQKEGYDVSGATLIMCPDASAEAQDAALLCEKLGIPHTVYNVTAEFRSTVMMSFANSYACGETPNPCVECNPKIKLGKLCEIARSGGFDCVATGHYAVCGYSEKYGRKVISVAADAKKDQSYMLWKLCPSQVEMLVFPLGAYEKQDTRAVAQEHGLSTAHKKDSQDICFVKDGCYAELVEELLDKKFPHGEFVDTNGNVLGTHKGIIRYTTGQRKGLGLSLPAPLYVKHKQVESNRVVLCPEDQLYTNRVFARDVNFQAFDTPKNDAEFAAEVKLRYSAKRSPARIIYNAEQNSMEILFETPQRAATPGQSAVLYDADGVLLGGGIITAR